MQDMITSQFKLGEGIDVMTKHGRIHGIIKKFGNTYIGIIVDWMHSPIDIPYTIIQSFTPIRDCDLGV